MNKKSVFFSFVFCLIASSTFCQSQLLQNWQFHKGAVGGIWDIWRGNFQLEWNAVQVPHCFNAFDAVDPDVKYYQGEGWYKSLLTIDNPHEDGRTLLHFEGSGHKTSVYIYDQKVATHVGGYDEFVVDITEAVAAFKQRKIYKDKFKEKIPIAILADNTRDLEMIPSDMSDFNLYGGIYRKLYLQYQPNISIQNLRIESNLSKSFKKGNLNIITDLYNPQKVAFEKPLKIEIIDPNGKIINQKTKQVSSKEGQINITLTVKKPQLWSPASPQLYTVRASLNPTEENNIKTEKIGFRTFEFKKNGPFYLNGERLLIRGTHRHEDQAGYGAAEPDSLVRKEMIMMKEMGVNFVRLGHYQQSELVLDLCDSLGFMVWEEIPWCRGGLGGEKYQNQAKQMLTNMITQHYNHPSVIIWGLGNENDWAGDTEVFDKEAIRGFMTELNDLSHQLDPSRKTGIRRCKFCTDLIDVYSPSIWAGWYGGKFTEYKKVSYREMKKTDHFFHMEWGGSSHAFRHSEDPDKGLENIMTKGDAAEKDGDFLMTGGKARVSKDGTWTTSYMVNLFDWTLKEQETMEWLTGAAAWIFKDYSTPVRPTNPLPYVNQKGVVERDLKKKESYYVFQSYWAEKAMLHIYGSTWDTRWGTEGEDKLLKVYSNCEKVELFLNGKSLGFKYRDAQNYPAAGLRWHATFKKGKNEVRAIGFKNGVKVEHEISFNYQTEKWGAPTKLELKKIAETADEVTIEARIYDKNGVQCLDARNFIRFGLTGEGRLVDNLGTSDGSRYIQVYNGRAIIKVKTNQGISVASVTSEGLEPAFLTIK